MPSCARPTIWPTTRACSRDERRRRLDAWLVAWREASQGGDHSRSGLSRCARRDRRVRDSAEPARRVGGRHDDGSEARASGAPDTYATFDDLYRYCYLVASVVGLVCIRIFGYSDPRAEKLAEETGIAFQLTNILRDVAEDAERNRVYLPLEDLAAHHVSLDALLHRAAGTPPRQRRASSAWKDRQTARKTIIKSAQALLPLIDRESRPALWVLVSIYHALLKRIERAEYDVFSRRASVPLAAEARHPGAGPGAHGACDKAVLRTIMNRPRRMTLSQSHS